MVDAFKCSIILSFLLCIPIASVPLSPMPWTYNYKKSTSTYTPPVDPVLPRKMFFSLPDFSHLKINSDGSFLSYLAHSNDENDGYSQLMVMELSINRNITSVVFDASYGEVKDYSWTCLPTYFLATQQLDDTISYVVYQLNPRFTGDDAEQFDTHLLASSNGSFTMSIIDRTCLNHTEKVFILQDFVDQSTQFVEEYDLINRQTSIILRSETKLGDIYFDNLPRLRLITVTEDGTVYFRPNSPMEKYFQMGDSTWTTYKRVKTGDEYFTRPVGFSKDNAHMFWLDSTASDFAKLVQHPFGHFSSRKIIYNPIHGEIGALLWDRLEMNILSLVENEDIPLQRLLSNKIGIDFQYLRNEFGMDDSAIVVSTSKNLSRWIIAVTGNNIPIQYYLYHRDENRFDKLFDIRPEITKQTPSGNVTIVRLNHAACYIYRPAMNSYDCNKTILIIGDNRIKLTAVYDAMTAWLNNRGYIVAKCNVLGSVGYGKRWYTPGLKLDVIREFLRQMHQLKYHNFAWPNSTALIVLGENRLIAEDASIKCGGYLKAVIALENLYECDGDFRELLTIKQKIPPATLPERNPTEVFFTSRSVPFLVIEGFQPGNEELEEEAQWRNPNVTLLRIPLASKRQSRQKQMTAKSAFGGFLEIFLAKILKNDRRQSFWPVEYPQVQIVKDGFGFRKINPFT